MRAYMKEAGSDQRRSGQLNGIGSWLVLAALLLLALVLLFPAARPAAAQGGTCIDDVTGRTNTCTASDVRIGTFYNIQNLSCSPGDTVTLFLRAELVAGAKDRYDIGLFVATDGGNARKGACYQDYLAPPLADGGSYNPGAPFPEPAGGPFYNAELVEDPADTCGDLEQGVNTYRDLAPGIGITVPCVDSNGDGLLDVSACASWDNQKTHTCLGAEDAVPSTKSKCRCETLQVGNVFVEPGQIQVSKAASPDNVNEPGGDVTFAFTVKNLSGSSMIISSMVDSVFGNLAVYPGSTCSVPQALTPAGQAGSTYTCSISAYVGGPPGLVINTVTFSGVDSVGNPISGSATEEVVINDTPSILEVSKTVDPPAVVAPGGEVQFTIQVYNSSDTPGPVTLTKLTDNVYGDLMDENNPLIRESTCVPQVLEPGQSCVCTFKADVTGDAGSGVVDIVTAYAEATSSDSATVAVVPQPPPTGVALPPPVVTGGLVTLGGMLLATGAWLRRRMR